MATYRTASEWATRKRVVKPKIKPTRWLYHDTSGAKLALYAEGQTLPRSEFRVVKASELPDRPKNAVYYTWLADVEQVRVWIGSRHDLIQLLKAHKFRYHPRSGRWWKFVSPEHRDNMLDAVKALGYTPIERTE